jgi:hypothetical protein
MRPGNPRAMKEEAMPEYERSRTIQAPADDVFAFVSDVGNLPSILPTVESMEPQAKDRLHVHGTTRGHAYDDDGWFRVDEAKRRLEWANDERTYSGWMTVGAEDGAALVVAHLSFAPYVTETGAPYSGEAEVQPDPIEESLETALDSLRNIMEGTGGKEEPATFA